MTIKKDNCIWYVGEAELRKVVNISSISEIMALNKDEQDEYDDTNDLKLEYQSTTLILFDLTLIII